MLVLDAFSLAGRVSVVTGAARGIGRALAKALGEAGSDVVLLVRDPAGAAHVVEELQALGVTASAVSADATEPEHVRRAVQEVVDRFAGRRVDHAGIASIRAALEVTPQEWRHVMDTNVDGVWNCAQAFGRVMVAQERG